MQACTLAGKLHTFTSLRTEDAAACPENSEQADTEADKASREKTSLIGSTCRPAWLPKTDNNTSKLHTFYAHADNSNDIFRVAARAVATAASSLYMQTALHSHLNGDTECPEVYSDRMLLEAWKPFQAVHKAIWWDHLPMPEDLSDEAAWRNELKCERSLSLCSLYLLLIDQAALALLHAWVDLRLIQRALVVCY